MERQCAWCREMLPEEKLKKVSADLWMCKVAAPCERRAKERQKNQQ